jgi:hypothetical protein
VGAERVGKAIARLERDSKPVTFQLVAREAGVARQLVSAAGARSLTAQGPTMTRDNAAVDVAFRLL